jgi:two-component system, OmpR family, response regulator
MSPRLLLVDDDQDIRTIACMTLERLGGWEVIRAASGSEALVCARESGPFDAVLLDVMMPGMDGPSTLLELQAEDLVANTPIVFLTAKVQVAEREHLISIGAAGVIAKPFDPLTLSNELQQIVQNRLAQD